MDAILVLGCNSGNNKETILQKAVKELETIGKIIKKSPIYESPDYLGSGRSYLNLIVKMDFTISEARVNTRLKFIELEFGRDDVARERGEVPLDIDIVVWDGSVKRDKDYKSTYFIKGMKLMEEN